jgi:hypothetical protein
LKKRQWVLHQLVHLGLKYEHPAGSLGIEMEIVGVQLAGSLVIEV